MRRIPLLVGFALVAAACGGDIKSTPVAGTPSVTTAPSLPAGASPGLATDFEGEPAADFTLALENRDGPFVLSEAETPVYLVFWAEW